MKKRVVMALLCLGLTTAILTPVIAADDQRVYITSSPNSEDGFTATTSSPRRSSSTYNAYAPESSSTYTTYTRRTTTYTTDPVTESSNTDMFTEGDSNYDANNVAVRTLEQPVAYVKDGRYYNTWAGRSTAINNGLSNFGEPAVYQANSWRYDSVMPPGTMGPKSDEWDAWNARMRLLNPPREEKKEEEKKRRDDNSDYTAPNLITYKDTYGDDDYDTYNGYTRSDVIYYLQSLLIGNNGSTIIIPRYSSTGTSVTGKVATIDQSVADQAAEEQRRAEQEKRQDETTTGVAVSTYAYVNILGAVTPAQYDQFNSYLREVIAEDPELIELFKKKGWKIVLTTADLNDLLYNGETMNVVGCTVDNKKAIYIKAGDSSYCIIHEFGHFLDTISGYPSSSMAYRSIYEDEASSLSAYSMTSPDEFFAETYYYLIVDPATARAHAPKSYDYVLDIRQVTTRTTN